MKDTIKDFSDTKLSLKLGEDTYKLNFGIYTRRRIEEAHPRFEILNSDMPDFEIIPFLIQKAIEPEEQKWKDEKEFIALYETCKDEENIKLVLLAYQNSVGFTNRQFEPLVQRLTKLLNESKEEGKSKETQTK